MVHTTAPVTFTDRMAAATLVTTLRSAGAHATAGLVEDARQAESFPGSYTREAVEHAEAALRAIGQDQGRHTTAVQHHLRQVQDLRTLGRWYA